jgi:hypothetical protein
MKAKKVETFSAYHQFDDAGLGLLRRQAELGQQLPQPRKRGLGLLPGLAHHQQIVGLCGPRDYADRGVRMLVGGVDAG